MACSLHGEEKKKRTEVVQGVLQSLKQRKEWWLGVARNTYAQCDNLT